MHFALFWPVQTQENLEIKEQYPFDKIKLLSEPQRCQNNGISTCEVTGQCPSHKL